MSGTDLTSPGRTVWLLGTDFEPRGSTLYTLRLAGRLADHGYHPTIVCESATWIPGPLRRRLDVVEAPGLTGRFRRPFRVHRLLREYASSPPDLIHGQRRSLARVAAELADGFGRPYLLTVHDLIHPGESLHLLPERLGAVVAVSPSVKRDLVVETGLPTDLVVVIPNGVEAPNGLKLPEVRSDRKVPVVGTASALEAAKGLTYFLMAAELILSSGSEVEFLIAGSGPEEEVLRRAARHLDIANRVTFVGFVREYRAVLDTLDVFVNPALEQGQGTVMLEAMALGKPVVASQVGGIADFFTDSEHLLLVPPANHVLLAERIKYLIDNPLDARNLGVLGQQLVREKFSVERMTEATVALYDSLLADDAEILLTQLTPQPM